MTIEVVLLGTGSPLPDPERAGPSTLVRAGGHTFLFDAGRAVGLRLAATGTPAAALSAVLLTHLHSDHLTDLNDVITGRWVTGLVPSPLPIFGPPGTDRVVRAILERKYDGVCPPDYVEMVVGSISDDPVRLRPPRYARKPAAPGEAKPVAGMPVEKIALVAGARAVDRQDRLGDLLHCLVEGRLGRVLCLDLLHEFTDCVRH